MRDFDKDFKEWLIDKNHYGISWKPQHERHPYLIGQEEYFFQLPFSMQWGVYVDFFDEHGILIEIGKNIEPDILGDWWVLINTNEFGIDYIKTRQEARQSSINKAKEMYSKTNNKV